MGAGTVSCTAHVVDELRGGGFSAGSDNVALPTLAVVVTRRPAALLGRSACDDCVKSGWPHAPTGAALACNRGADAGRDSRGAQRQPRREPAALSPATGGHPVVLSRGCPAQPAARGCGGRRGRGRSVARPGHSGGWVWCVKAVVEAHVQANTSSRAEPLSP